MKLFKRSLKRFICIFLAVMVLFLGVNNSYFSPYKMDEVEATGLEIGVAYITVELLIELICAIGIAGLGCALIDNIKDWDWEEIAVDLHDWCRENYDVINQYVTDGANALKEWALADEWVVIEGGGGSAPQPSPDGDSSKKFVDKVWGLNDWTIANILAVGSLAGQALYEQKVIQDEGITEIAKAYVNDKVTNFTNGNPLSLTDPITVSLQQCFFPSDFSGYDGSTPKINENGKFEYYSSFISNGSTYTSDINELDSFNYGGYIFTEYFKNLNYTVYYIKTPFTSFYYDANGNKLYRDARDKFVWKIVYDDGNIVTNDISCNFPIFLNENDYNSWLNGENILPVNIARKYNYIDTDDDYGWASTAALSPADLAAANPALADNLNGKEVSISSLVAAINALKEQLEEQDPNTGGSADPVPYPDTPTYTVIVNKVVSDPDIFPDSDSDPGTDPGKDPVTDPDKDPDPGTSTETGKDYTGFLGQIINLLKSILQAIKDFMSWFIIDFDAIKAHLLLALDSLSDFSGFNAFMDIVTDIKGQISDNYDYPVIKMTTPDILLPFFKSSEIILIDFEDYAKYFLMVRLAIKFSLYFGFGLWIIRDIKVAFTLN